jgi:hypothetical protein
VLRLFRPEGGVLEAIKGLFGKGRFGRVQEVDAEGNVIEGQSRSVIKYASDALDNVPGLIPNFPVAIASSKMFGKFSQLEAKMNASQ